MSYCRWSDDSDVYVYSNIMGGYNIHIRLNHNLIYNGPVDIQLTTKTETLDKLLKLKSQGLAIPQTAIDRLNREII